MSNIIFFGNQKLVQGLRNEVTTITNILESAGHNILLQISDPTDFSKIPSPLPKNTIAVLASFGYIIPEDIINLFEPVGILNIHPSLLPKYRGSTPIETAILNGDQTTGVSIMKIAKSMDAGPIYSQTSISISKNDNKLTLCEKLTKLGAKTILELLQTVVKNTTPTPTSQDSTKATYTQKLDKSMSKLQPSAHTAEQLDRQVRAFLNFPKSKYTFGNTECIVLSAHPADQPSTPLDLKCTDNKYLIIDTLQPASRKPMTAAEFLRGYSHDSLQSLS